MGHNATKAAMAAGFSNKTVQVQGSRMLKNVKVLSKLEDRLLDHRERCSMTAELEEARTMAMMTNKPAADGRAIMAMA